MSPPLSRSNFEHLHSIPRAQNDRADDPSRHFESEESMSSCNICCLSHARSPPTLIAGELVTSLELRWHMNSLDPHLQHPDSLLEGSASTGLTTARQPTRLAEPGVGEPAGWGYSSGMCRACGPTAGPRLGMDLSCRSSAPHPTCLLLIR